MLIALNFSKQFGQLHSTADRTLSLNSESQPLILASSPCLTACAQLSPVSSFERKKLSNCSVLVITRQSITEFRCEKNQGGGWSGA